MLRKIITEEILAQEQVLLSENEIAVNRQAATILFVIGAFFIPFIFVLRFFGFFLFTIEEGLMPLITTAVILVIPRIVGIFNQYSKPWFKYTIVAAVTLGIPKMYIGFDYMMLMLWIMPILASCLYFNKRFNIIALLFDILVLGVTSYYRSYLRMENGLIDERIGGLFKDFLVSYTTYTLLLVVLFIFIRAITNKANFLLNEMIQSKRYEKMSTTDGLTGLFNYRYLVSTMEKYRLEYEKYGTPFSMIVFDADHFKAINDTYGHLVGDKALIQISNCLKEQIRENDVLGRYGGEEFIVIFPNTTKDEAFKISERCREAVSQICIKGTNHRLSVSGGIEQYAGGTIEDLINGADRKMYYAKDTGRNKVETCHQQPLQRVPGAV